jgi:hypothetical protein
LFTFYNTNKSIDIESLLIVLVLFSVGRFSAFLSQTNLFTSLSILTGFGIVLIAGAKLSSICVTLIGCKNSRLLRLSLSPLLGLGLVYMTWMSIASFSSYAPMITLIVVLLCVLLPPRLNTMQITRRMLSSFSLELHGKRLIYSTVLIFQLILMFLISNELSNAGNSTWLHTIFDGLSFWVYPCIFIIFIIPIALSLCNSRLWIISLLVLSFWATSFMLSRGFIHFGGDDGENLAIVDFLAKGGKTPFLDLNPSGSYSNWRYGSFLTLFFQSNMAFVSFAVGVTPSFDAGIMSNVISTVILFIGSFTISRVLLKNDFARRLTLLFIMIFNTAGFWWQFRFDPNLLVYVLVPSYLTIVLLLPSSKKGVALFTLSSLIMYLVHPTALGLILPCIIYKIAVWLYRNTKKKVVINKKQILIGVLIVTVLALIFAVIPNLPFLFLRFFSATHLFGLSSGQSLIIGNFVYKSYLINYYYVNYTLVFLFAFLGLVFLLPLWKTINTEASNKMKPFIVISFMIVLEFLIFDLFVSADPFPAWRLWASIPTILIPIIFLPFGLLYNRKPFQNKSKNRFLGLNAMLPKIVTVLILSLLLTVSFVQTAYPTEKSLNLDTLSTQEYDLLTSLATIDLNQSLILAESPTLRYIMGIIEEWPPTTPTYYSRYDNWPALYFHSGGKARIKAFGDLAYDGTRTTLVDLATNENITTVYVVILNRYAGVKSVDWYGGRAYVSNLPSFGSVAFSNQAGLILKLQLSDLRRDVSLENWQISAALGVTNHALEVEENTLCIGANFSDRYQALKVTQHFPLINLTEYEFFSVQYKSDNHIGSPHLRIFLRDSNNVSVELLPTLFSSNNFTTVTHNIQNLPITNAVSIELSLDSGSPASRWSGPGEYNYYLEGLFFSTFT